MARNAGEYWDKKAKNKRERFGTPEEKAEKRRKNLERQGKAKPKPQPQPKAPPSLADTIGKIGKLGEMKRQPQPNRPPQPKRPPSPPKKDEPIHKKQTPQGAPGRYPPAPPRRSPGKVALKDPGVFPRSDQAIAPFVGKNKKPSTAERIGRGVAGAAFPLKTISDALRKKRK